MNYAEEIFKTNDEGKGEKKEKKKGGGEKIISIPIEKKVGKKKK